MALRTALSFLSSPRLWAWLLYYEVFLASWILYPSYLYGGIDGQLSEWLATSLKVWGSPLELVTLNPYQADGSLYIPINPWVNPGSLALSLPLSADLARIVSYTIYWTELAASTLLLGRAFGLPSLQAHFSAMLVVLLTFPSFDLVLGMPGIHINAPYYAHGIAIANSGLSILHKIGTAAIEGSSLARRMVLICGWHFAAIWLFWSFPMVVLSWLPTLIALCLGVVIGCFRWIAVRWRLVAVLCLATAAWAFSVPDFYLGLVSTTARAGWTSFTAMPMSLDTLWEGLRSFDPCFEPFGGIPLICSKRPAMVLLQFFALAGAMSALASRSGQLAGAGIGYLLFLFGLYGFAFLIHMRVWTGIFPPVTAFLFWPAWSFHAAFAVRGFVWLVCSSLGRASRLLSRGGWQGGPARPECIREWQQIKGIAILALLPLAAAYMIFTQIGGLAPTVRHLLDRVRPPQIWPSHDRRQSQITALLQNQVMLTPYSTFRGSVVSFFGAADSPLRETFGPLVRYGTLDQYLRAKNYLQQSFQNYHMLEDLWTIKIPTLEEYGQMISPALLAMFQHFLATPEDRFSQNYLLLYRVNVDIIRGLGVRYIITDLPINHRRLSLRTVQRPMYLYETDAPNLATFSPTKVSTAATADAIVARMRDPGFLMEEEVVFQEPVVDIEPLVRADSSQMIFEPGAVRILAESRGRSILLLPLQFSRCLKQDDKGRGWRIFRANLALTAIEFRGRLDARIPFRFGLGREARCRLADARQILALGIWKVVQPAE